MTLTTSMSHRIRSSQSAAPPEILYSPSEETSASDRQRNLQSTLSKSRCDTCRQDRKKVCPGTVYEVLANCLPVQCVFSSPNSSCDRCRQYGYECTSTESGPQTKRRKLVKHACDYCRKLKQKVCMTQMGKFQFLRICSVFQRSEAGRRSALDVSKVVFHVPNRGLARTQFRQTLQKLLKTALTTKSA
jgi:hypothetical protein